MIAELLSYGEKSAISTPDLCRVLGITDTRELRQIVAKERKAGALILSSCAGYFLPESVDEVRRFVAHEDKRARSIMTAIKPARDILKQLDRLQAGQTTIDL